MGDGTGRQALLATGERIPTCSTGGVSAGVPEKIKAQRPRARFPDRLISLAARGKVDGKLPGGKNTIECAGFVSLSHSEGFPMRSKAYFPWPSMDPMPLNGTAQGLSCLDVTLPVMTIDASRQKPKPGIFKSRGKSENNESQRG